MVKGFIGLPFKGTGRGGAGDFLPGDSCADTTRPPHAAMRAARALSGRKEFRCSLGSQVISPSFFHQQNNMQSNYITGNA